MHAGLFALLPLCTRPWLGGDGSVLFSIETVAPSFPLGIIPAYGLGGLTILTKGSPFGHFLCCSAFAFAPTTVFCCLAGYLQWFVVLPLIMRRVRLREF